jgi:hypothetical protein
MGYDENAPFLLFRIRGTLDQIQQCLNAAAVASIAAQDKE